MQASHWKYILDSQGLSRFHIMSVAVGRVKGRRHWPTMSRLWLLEEKRMRTEY